MKLQAPDPVKKPGDDTSVHPFVNAFANIGAIMGRDLGVIALRAVAAERGGPNAILVYAAGNIPDVILAKVPEHLRENLYVVMIVPPKADLPGFLFQDVQVQAAEVTIADGSRLVAFIRQT